MKGALGGRVLGYNYQINNIALGAEADLQATAIKGSFDDIPPCGHAKEPSVAKMKLNGL